VLTGVTEFLRQSGNQRFHTEAKLAGISKSSNIAALALVAAAVGAVGMMASEQAVGIENAPQGAGLIERRVEPAYPFVAATHFRNVTPTAKRDPQRPRNSRRENESDRIYTPGPVE
jgi:hypothetical protein